MTPTAGAAGADRAAARVEAAAALLGPSARRDVGLGERTTYRVGGRAALAVVPRREDELLEVAAVVAATGVPVLVVGRGSNLLVADAGFAGLAVLLGDGFDDIDIEAELVTAGGATSLPVLARRTAAAGLRGFEWAVGVPGSVGGAVRMNAGGHGSDMAACLEAARVVGLRSATVAWRPVGQLGLGYRRSSLTPTDVVVAARIRCRAGDPAEAEAELAEIVRWRVANQPGGRNAGSVFTNPPEGPAGRLVEQAGMKGYRVGSAEVSTKHANFIQVDEGGSADDVVALIAVVRARVREVTGVDLSTEIRLVGFPATYPREMPCAGSPDA